MRRGKKDTLGGFGHVGNYLRQCKDIFFISPSFTLQQHHHRMTEDAQIQTLMLDVKLIQPLLLLLMTPLLVIPQWILLMTQQWILLMTPLLVIPQWILLMTQQWILLMTPLLVIRQELSTWVPSSRLFSSQHLLFPSSSKSVSIIKNHNL